jgi:hypothetical protein
MRDSAAIMLLFLMTCLWLTTCTECQPGRDNFIQFKKDLTE